MGHANFQGTLLRIGILQARRGGRTHIRSRMIIVIFRVAAAYANGGNQVGPEMMIDADVSGVGPVIAIVADHLLAGHIIKPDNLVSGVVHLTIAITQDADGLSLDLPAAIQMDIMLEAIQQTRAARIPIPENVESSAAGIIILEKSVRITDLDTNQASQGGIKIDGAIIADII